MQKSLKSLKHSLESGTFPLYATDALADEARFLAALCQEYLGLTQAYEEIQRLGAKKTRPKK